MENIVILGSTGSVGKQVLDVISLYPKKYRVFGLAAKDEISELKSQIEKFKPKAVSVEAEEIKEKLSKKIKKPVQILIGEKGLVYLSSHPKVSTVFICTSGTVAFSALFAAISKRKKIIQANKETIIMGGEIINKELKKHNLSIIPIDSEHSAIFQCLKGEDKKDVKKIILTCSGGPFRDYSFNDLERVTAEKALSHPVWKMGPKISIDSATLMNKGFEIIEASHLFNVPLEKIEVVIHPEGVIHSMVEFLDGAVKGILASPDMRGPIEYALFHPKRGKGAVAPLNLLKTEKLSFYEPDEKKFPCLRLAKESLKIGKTAPAVLVFADEIAVKKFLAGRIKFLDIPRLIKKALEKHRPLKNPSVSDILKIEKEVSDIFEG